MSELIPCKINGMICGKLRIGPLIHLAILHAALVERNIPTVERRLLLFDNICLDRYSEMVCLTREICRGMIVLSLHFKGWVSKIAPENSSHSQFMCIFKRLTHFLNLPIGFLGAKINRASNGSGS